ncbi:MAG: hypothetical protein ACC641_08095 [Acidiferrobacterales bacterium]
MRLFIVLTVLMSVSFTLPVGAASSKEEVIEIGGMSIIGNRELPKTLYIVPWKDSDVSSEADFGGDLLNEKMKVVDQEEFVRQLDYYELGR